jgi:hypothetical protein
MQLELQRYAPASTSASASQQNPLKQLKQQFSRLT